MSERDIRDWWEDRTDAQKFGLFILFVLGGIGLLFLFGLVVMLLWNWLMPDIFGLPTISYWQGWGLLILSSILFKDIGGSSDGGERKKDKRRKQELRRYVREQGEDVGTEAAASPTPEAGPLADPVTGLRTDPAPAPKDASGAANSDTAESTDSQDRKEGSERHE